METKPLEMIYLELKYCERCGGLWFRRKGDPWVYCQPCSEQCSAVEDHENRSGISYARLRRNLAGNRSMIDFLGGLSAGGEA